ncbi:hypothetical protein [Echinicola shivajiensis]|uniref:hypothetical protein n=1 Tax=Echinicola shivajiensis TaxID=1035916 RepID=UPI001BFCC503|nr:hypothetical protein [Echinicola shivajiensis]
MKKIVFFILTLIPLLYGCDSSDKSDHEPTFSYSLLVLDEEGFILENIPVELYDDTGKLLETLNTDIEGKVVFTGLTEGEYSYTVIGNEDSPMSGNFRLDYISLEESISVITKVIKQNASIIVTGICSDPRGSDGAAAGTSSSYDGGNIIVEHKGGYEYIQLMALEDIDFSQTPYSVVICDNSAAGPNGWAEGGMSTIKFDLKEGSAAKGSFFYVGGMSKVLSGYGSCGSGNDGYSTDISNANWIRTIDYKTDGGDGFGDPTGGLLGNMSGDGSNTADGIAVFEGLNVTEASIPIDAVFYGTLIGGAFDEENGYGYRIPENSDLYSNIDSEGNEQPFFGQGSNTYLFDQPNQDVGGFNKLGGVTTEKIWLESRKSTIKYFSYCKEDGNTLSEIEEDEGVTVFQVID